MRNKIIWILVVLALAVAAYWFYNKRQAGGAGQAGFPSGQQVTQVTAVVVKPQPVTVTMNLPGRTVAYQQSQVRPQVSGIITERLFKEGSLVEKGQQLYQLDDARYAANLKSAKANLMSAKANLKTTEARYKRVKSLEQRQAISEQDLDDVMAQLDQAKAAIAVQEAAVALEQINVDYTHVYAPISGRIGKSNLTVGALVTASQQQSLAVITQLDPMYVDLQVSGEQAVMVQQQLNQNAALEVVLSDVPGQEKVQGVLEFSDVNVNETTGAVGLRAKVDNPNKTLLPGLFVNAQVFLGEQNSILIPQRAAIRKPSGELLVWVIENNNQVRAQLIKVSHAQNNQWVVVDGLSDGDQIVVEGYQRLAEGAQVNATPWQDASAAAQATNTQQE